MEVAVDVEQPVTGGEEGEEEDHRWQRAERLEVRVALEAALHGGGGVEQRGVRTRNG